MYGNGDTSQDPMNLPQGAWPQGNRIGMRRPAGNMNLGVSAQAQSVPFSGPQGGGPAGEPGGGGALPPHTVGTLGLQSPPQQWYRQGGGAASVEQDPGVAGPGDPARLLDPVQAFLRSQQQAQMSPLLSQLSGGGSGGYFQSGG